jgi:membrane protein
MILLKIAIEAFDRFYEDDGWALASHVALSAIMSLFPFLIFLTALAGFLGTGNLAEEATALIFDAWPEAVARPIAKEIDAVVATSGTGLLTVGAGLALYFSTNGIEALRVALNRAYGLKETRSRWITRLESVVYVFLAAAGLLALAFLVVLAPVIWDAAVRTAPWIGTYALPVTVARIGLATALVVAALIVLHLKLPSGRRTLDDIWPGIAVTVLLSLGYAIGFGWYLRVAAQTYVTTYAGLSSVMIAMVFLYAVSATFIYGGEFNAAAMRLGRRDVPCPPHVAAE